MFFLFDFEKDPEQGRNFVDVPLPASLIPSLLFCFLLDLYHLNHFYTLNIFFTFLINNLL